MSTTESDPLQTKWEYMQIARKTEEYLVHDLNKLGQVGWEMIAVSRQKQTTSGMGSAEAWVAFLKRPHTGELKMRATMEKAKDVAAPAADKPLDAELVDEPADARLVDQPVDAELVDEEPDADIFGFQDD
ncbi:MAG TPA: hypothetical protein VMY42_01225 [Thermoguttaceae bacterium]|nr:hypothetical protein [Thermoguttaceae bacterium]